MAKNKSRTRKQPELRTGGGRAAKLARSQERTASVARSAPRGPAVRMRPQGAGGALYMYLLAWLAVAGVAIVALVLRRWDTISYPDSLWLYAALGAIAVAPAVGRVSRSETDADSWGLQALLVPVALFVVEAITGPNCPLGANCASIGARGSLGIFWSLALIAACAIAAWGLARWMYRAAAKRRPASGRVRYSIVTAAMLMLFLFPGVVLAAGLLGGDLLLRDTPSMAHQAKSEVEQACFGLEGAPELAVRSAPAGYSADWTTFAVRQAHEDRKGIGKKALPKDWVGLNQVYPYEATVSSNGNGDVVDVTCRRVGTGTGNATADDLTTEEPTDNPLANKTIGHEFLPRFLADGAMGPTPEAKKQAAAAAKKAATAKAAKAKTAKGTK